MRVLALDIGSSSTRAALFDARTRRIGRVVARSYALRYSGDGAAELDASVLLAAFRAVYGCFNSRRIDVIASCAFWHGLLGLDGKLRPATPIYTWADSRSRAHAAELRAQFSEDELLQRTGCMLRFAFWPAKLRWLRGTDPALFRRVRFWVSPADWLVREISGQLFTSESMASGTGLFNQVSRRWDSEICEAVSVRADSLPVIRHSLGENASPKLLGAIGDGAASNLGSGAVSENVAAINLGTSAAVRVMTQRRLRIPAGLFRFFAERDTFVFGGATSNCGNLYVWCAREFKLSRTAGLLRDGAANDTLIALPFFVAERAPDWPEASATICGLTPDSSPAEITRALLTSAIYRISDVFDQVENAVGEIDRIIVSGGMTRVRGVTGILADALGRDIEVARDSEASLRGAAVHALLSGSAVSPSRPQSGRLIRYDKHRAELHAQRCRRQRDFQFRLNTLAVSQPGAIIAP